MKKKLQTSEIIFIIYVAFSCVLLINIGIIALAWEYSLFFVCIIIGMAYLFFTNRYKKKWLRQIQTVVAFLAVLLAFFYLILFTIPAFGFIKNLL